MNPQEFAARYAPVALVLGGSEGIGRQFAEQLAARGLDLVLVARTPAALEATAAEIRAAHGVTVTTYVRDLTAPDLESFADGVLGEHDVGLVVCNAGATHGIGAFLDAPLEKALQLVRLNCLAPLVFAHKVLNRRRGRGGALIVVSSMSGLCGTGLIASYAAAKSFEIALCEGLHWELGPAGLDVLCAVAGLTDTPAMRRSGLSFSAAAEKGYHAMSAEAVARGALEQLGQVPVWYAVGEATAGALRQLPRPQLTAAMSEASAAMYGVSRP
ncbi:MAG TPA: SDR family NAD(P)-dependent oxidoreductase [Steroidobacteraceae bacterium]|nr:SDR family NAD(P)-dependent oxidoreductase [Steroidobacteraceae bacterium]